jgi:RNA polymerase sigma-70 factor (ECF subfamily)
VKQHNDVELIQQTLNGNTDAFGDLIRRYQDAVYAIALRNINNFAVAEDIAQETFIEAYKSLGNLREPAKFGSWLHSVTLHQCNRWQRSQRELTSIDDPMVSIALCEKSSPDEEIESKELRQIVLDAIASLPEKTAEVVTMYYIDGLSYSEIASFLEIPSSTVRGRLDMGRKQLKEELINVVEEVLKENRPDERFTEKVLNEIIEQTRSAQERKAHDEVIQLCEKALEVLDHLDDTDEHKRTRINVLKWHGDKLSDWLGKHKEAADNIHKAVQIVADIGDKGEQAKWLLFEAIFLDRMGNPQAIREPIKEALRIYQESRDLVGQTVCEGIFDMLDILPKDWKYVCTEWTGLHTGYRSYPHKLVRSKESLTYVDMDLREMKAPAGLIGCGWLFYYRTIFWRIGHPNTVLDFPLDIGKSWTAQIEEEYDHQSATATKVIESLNDKVVIPAGSFEGCLRITNTIPEPPDSDFSDEIKVFRRRVMCGKETMWFAPGIGLVKYRHENLRDDVLSIQLTEYHIEDGQDGDYFPLAIGNQWRYEHHDDPTLVTENYRVVAQEGNAFHLACAIYSQALSGDDFRQYYQKLSDNERASNDINGELWATAYLVKHYSEIGDVPNALNTYQRMNELLENLKSPELKAKFLINALNGDMLSASELKPIIEGAEHTISIIEKTENKEALLRWLVTLSYFYRRHANYKKALECESKIISIYSSFGNIEWQAEAEAGYDLVEMLMNTPDGMKSFVKVLQLILHITESESEIFCYGYGWISDIPQDVRPANHSLYGLTDDLPLLKIPVKIGDKWKYDGYDFEVEIEVEADNESLVVPAGKFDKVVRICSRYLSNAPRERDDKANEAYIIKKGFLEGERRLWFVPGVGLIKSEHQHANGKKTTIELTDYHIAEPSNSYFPHSIGNRWNYDWRNEKSELTFKEQERVVIEKDGKFYLACSGYTTNAKEYGDPK